MPPTAFEFDLHRLNIVDITDLFTQDLHRARSDDDIIRIVNHATQARFDQDLVGGVTTYRWSLRSANHWADDGRPMLTVTLARSTLAQHGRVVTDQDIIEGVFDNEPALANTLTLVFDLKRHLVAVERVSQLMRSRIWRSAVEAILALAAKDLE